LYVRALHNFLVGRTIVDEIDMITSQQLSAARAKNA